MALIVKAETAKMTWKTSGARAAVHVGKKYLIMHCTSGANLSAGDTDPAGQIVNDEPVDIRASVFVEATAGEKDIGTLQFGLAQVTALHSYEFLYVGRLPSEGSTVIDMKKGFPGVASLDSKKGKGFTVDQRIFAKHNIDVIPSKTAQKGFNILVTTTDHPNNAVPLQFENRVAGVQNFLARIQRNQHFIVYLMTREGDAGPISILGRLGWAVQWDADINWSTKTSAPVTPVMRSSNLFPGQFVLGAPDASDAWANIALKRTEPTTNALDEAAASAAWDLRKSPICEQSRTRPEGFRNNFFS